MSTNTLATNIGQAAADLKDIKTAIIEKGVDVPAGTKTSMYDDLIRRIQSGSGGGDCDAIIRAAWQTVYSTRHRNELPDECTPFTNTLVTWPWLWSTNHRLEYIYCGFKNLYDGSNLFNEASRIRTVITNLDSLVIGNTMFPNCYMQTFEVENNTMPRLQTADGMFSSCTGLSSFGVYMPALENGYMMFMYSRTLSTFTSGIPNLKNGNRMFQDCTALMNFTSSLQSLEDGAYMFNGCNNLTVESLQNIITTLPDRSLTTNAILTIGSVNISKLDRSYTELAANKNWTLN